MGVLIELFKLRSDLIAVLNGDLSLNPFSYVVVVYQIELGTCFSFKKH